MTVHSRRNHDGTAPQLSIHTWGRVSQWHWEDGGEQLLHKLRHIVTSQKRPTKTGSFRLWVSTTWLHSTQGRVLLCVVRLNGDHQTAAVTVFDDAVQAASTSSQPRLRREKRVTPSRTVPVFYSIFFCRKSETLLAAMCIIYFYIICIIMYIFIYIYYRCKRKLYIYLHCTHMGASQVSPLVSTLSVSLCPLKISA